MKNKGISQDPTPWEVWISQHRFVRDEYSRFDPYDIPPVPKNFDTRLRDVAAWPDPETGVLAAVKDTFPSAGFPLDEGPELAHFEVLSGIRSPLESGLREWRWFWVGYRKNRLDKTAFGPRYNPGFAEQWWEHETHQGGWTVQRIPDEWWRERSRFVTPTYSGERVWARVGGKLYEATVLGVEWPAGIAHVRLVKPRPAFGSVPPLDHISRPLDRLFRRRPSDGVLFESDRETLVLGEGVEIA